MKKIHLTILITMIVSSSALSAQVLAGPRNTGNSHNPTGQNTFDASQFKLDTILAQRGDADAQYYVGKAFELGLGTRKDLKQAFTWYSKAANQNQEKAQYKLGTFYEYGIGVPRNIQKAMEWYKRAANSSRNQIVDRMNQQAFARRQQEIKRTLQTMNMEKRQHERAQKLAQEHARQRQLEAARIKRVAMEVARRPVSVRRVNIPDIVELILNNKWRAQAAPADYLPSSSTHCLRSSADEVVCFSDKKQRVINSQRVTYTTKATLTDFRSNGTFHVKYHYNVVHIAHASEPGVAVDPNGLKLTQGWQDPPLQMNCQTSDRMNLYCSHANVRLHFQH